MTKHRVCGSLALAPGKAVCAWVDNLRIAVFRMHDGSVHALEDRCPHRGALLSEGVVYDDFVACRDHGWSVCLRDGTVAAPDRGQVRAFKATESDGAIWIDFAA